MVKTQYRKRIVNPDTKRFVYLDTSKGTQIKKKFQRILQKKEKKQTLTTNETKFLDTILYSNFCQCTKSILIREYKKECPNKGLAYAVCTKRIYNNRGMKIPQNGSKKCRSTFKWYT